MFLLVSICTPQQWRKCLVSCIKYIYINSKIMMNHHIWYMALSGTFYSIYEFIDNVKVKTLLYIIVSKIYKCVSVVCVIKWFYQW